MAKGILYFLLAVSFLFFCPQVLAAPQIVVEPIAGNFVVGEAFSLSASATGLASNSAYYTKVRLRSISETWAGGETQNVSAGVWLSDTSGWSDFPQISSDANGSWNGTVTGRPKSTALTGQSWLVLRLKKTDGDPIDSASVSANVNPASVTSDTDETSTTQTPTINLTVPGAAVLGESFKISVSLKNSDPNKDYYLKAKGGPDEDHLTKMQTKNGNSWFSDNESWTSFPKVTVDGSGNWSGEIWGMFSEDKDAGNYKVLVRIKKQEADTFHNSDTKDIKLTKPAVPVLAAAVATRSVVPAAKPAKTTTAVAVLGTQSATREPEVLVAAVQTTNSPKKDNPWDFSVLIILGMGLVLSGGIMALFVHRESIYGIIEIIKGKLLRK